MRKSPGQPKNSGNLFNWGSQRVNTLDLDEAFATPDEFNDEFEKAARRFKQTRQRISYGNVSKKC